METQRRFIHPHNPNIMVIDVLDEKGRTIRTKNIEIKRNPDHWCESCFARYFDGCPH